MRKKTYLKNQKKKENPIEKLKVFLKMYIEYL